MGHPELTEDTLHTHLADLGGTLGQQHNVYLQDYFLRKLTEADHLIRQIDECKKKYHDELRNLNQQLQNLPVDNDHPHELWVQQYLRRSITLLQNKD